MKEAETCTCQDVNQRVALVTSDAGLGSHHRTAWGVCKIVWWGSALWKWKLFCFGRKPASFGTTIISLCKYTNESIVSLPHDPFTCVFQISNNVKNFVCIGIYSTSTTQQMFSSSALQANRKPPEEPALSYTKWLVIRLWNVCVFSIILSLIYCLSSAWDCWWNTHLTNSTNLQCKSSKTPV
jgi:hypothetical protein